MQIVKVRGIHLQLCDPFSHAFIIIINPHDVSPFTTGTSLGAVQFDNCSSFTMPSYPTLVYIYSYCKRGTV